MCFSATANFVGASVVGALGITTLTQVRRVQDIPFAALPALFSVHQLIEAVVWLGLEGHISRGVGDVAAYVYVLYAQGVLPILMPLAVLLIEPSRRRRRIIAPFVLVGLAAGTYLFWVDVAHPVHYQIVNHSIAYQNSGSLVGVFAVFYLVATCGSALCSGYRWIIGFGVANVIGLSVVYYLLQRDFTSVWCAYAAVISFMVLMFFLRQPREHRPRFSLNPTTPPAAGAT